MFCVFRTICHVLLQALRGCLFGHHLIMAIWVRTLSFFVSHDDQRFIDTKIACFICIYHVLSPKQVRNTDKQLLKLREQYVQDLRMSECRVIKKNRNGKTLF